MSTDKDERIAALEAHIVRLTKAPATSDILEEIHRRADKEGASDGCDFTVTIMADEYAAFEAEQEAMRNDAPATSLARRDAVKQAEALERFKDRACNNPSKVTNAYAIEDEIAEYRRQAEEAT